MADLRQQLVERFAELGVEEYRVAGGSAGFSAFTYRGTDVAHFHNDHELDIRLGKALIQREGLVHSPHSRVHPNRDKKSQWIEVRFKSAADIDHVVRLMQLAIEQV